MSLYSYSALDGEDNLKSGILEGDDKDAVANRLMQSGLRPLEINPSKGEKTSFSFNSWQRDKVSPKDIDFFTKQISLLLGAGLSLDAALRVINQHSHKPSLREFTLQIGRKLKEGLSFSQALADYPKHFSSMYVNIARAGEEGGILPAMLTRISDYQATFQELRQYVISASVYPLFLLAIGIIAVIVLITVILPRFEILFEGMGQQLPLHVQFLMNSAKVIGNHLFLFFGTIIAVPTAIVYYLQTNQGKIFLDQQLIKTPFISGFIRDLETTRIFRTLEVLVNNGVHLATALKIGSGVAGNQAYKDLLNKASKALKEGQQVGQKLKGTGLLPDLAADLLSIGEESGQVGLVCGQIANHYEDALRLKIKRAIALIEPLFILAIALIAGYIVISMLSVILSINDIAG
ncbi:MAG: type II secretion system F family protein [Proteobacteria bacterium]|nr:type II secretion system F family protein [Pseudomonadota bacterium]MBU1716614.1 type II secretion system F family protein [Pseudomonadota bacterium]